MILAYVHRQDSAGAAFEWRDSSQDRCRLPFLAWAVELMR